MPATEPEPAWEGTGEYKELSALYEKAEEKGIFIFEAGNSEDGCYLASAGKISDLEQAGYSLEDIPKLGMGDVMRISTPGVGNTRKKAIQKAMAEHKRLKKGKKPTSGHEDHTSNLSLYGSFRENGYLIKAFMPNSPSQPQQWTIEVYRTTEGQVEAPAPLRVEVLPMSYEPLFGPDVGDVATLEKKADELLKALADT